MIKQADPTFLMKSSNKNVKHKEEKKSGVGLYIFRGLVIV